MLPDLNIPAMPTRLVSVNNRVITVNDAPPMERFIVSLTPPTTTKANDGSPRDRAPSVIRWRAGLLGPATVLTAGSRLTLARLLGRPYENTTYELLVAPTEFRTAGVTQGRAANVCAVSELYPCTGSLIEQDGTVVSDMISVALWDNREQQQATGQYKDLSGEAPPEFADDLGGNRSLVIGGVRYRITAPVTDYEGPRVKFTARQANV